MKEPMPPTSMKALEAQKNPAILNPETPDETTDVAVIFATYAHQKTTFLYIPFTTTIP